jgi:hypothetical protein
MTTFCEACAAGPVSIGGHDAMRVRSLNEAGMSFTCSRCPALWTRSYSSSGRYVWSPSAEVARDGRVSLPPNTASVEAYRPMASSRVPMVGDHWLATQLSWKRPRRKPS